MMATYTVETLVEKIEDLEAQIAAKDAVTSELGPYWSKWLDHWKDRAEKAEAQIAEQGSIIQLTQIDRDTWRSKYHEAAAQIAAKDAALRKLTERFDDFSPDETIGAFGSSGQWVELMTVGELRELAAPARETDPYEAERKQRVTRGIAEIEAMRAREAK